MEHACKTVQVFQIIHVMHIIHACTFKSYRIVLGLFCVVFDRG